MTYARVENGVVKELIPAVDPAFPTIPIESRFHASIIAQLVEIPEGVVVEQLYLYDSERKTFTAPSEAEGVETAREESAQ